MHVMTTDIAVTKEQGCTKYSEEHSWAQLL